MKNKIIRIYTYICTHIYVINKEVVNKIIEVLSVEKFGNIIKLMIDRLSRIRLRLS